MKSAAFPGFESLRQLCRTCVLIAAVICVLASTSAAQPLQSAPNIRGQQCANVSATAVAYISNYLTHKGPTNWIHFRNIADWGSNFLDRSSTTEYLQLANSIKTAAYYHAFSDNRGQPLDGRSLKGYVLMFPAGQLPPALRFWSLTAYTPDTIELVPNTANKYAVASYTPGLEFNSDGSLSIYMAETRPSGEPEANWLPVPHGAFNVVIRIYGPTGDVVDNTYVPPGIQKR